MTDENDETPARPAAQGAGAGLSRADGAGSRCGVEGDRGESAVGSRQSTGSRQSAGEWPAALQGRPDAGAEHACRSVDFRHRGVAGARHRHRADDCTDAVETVATAPVTRAPSMALEVAAAQHLSQSEAYLTLFRASVRDGAGGQPPGCHRARAARDQSSPARLARSRCATAPAAARPRARTRRDHPARHAAGDRLMSN